MKLEEAKQLQKLAVEVRESASQTLTAAAELLRRAAELGKLPRSAGAAAMEAETFALLAALALEAVTRPSTKQLRTELPSEGLAQVLGRERALAGLQAILRDREKGGVSEAESRHEILTVLRDWPAYTAGQLALTRPPAPPTLN